MCDEIQRQSDEICKSTMIYGVTCLFWWSKIIDKIIYFFQDIYNENDCIKDVVDCTTYYTTYTYNTMTNCKCEPFATTWISSCIVGSKNDSYKFFDTYTVLETFNVERLHSYFITFLNNKQSLEKNELVILKGYDEMNERKFYICRQPANKIHPEYKLNYSSFHFLSVNYKHPQQSESISLPIGKEWCVVGNEILGYTHILRMLNYQNCSYVFNMDYVVEVIDTNIKVFELHSDEFLRIGEDSYSLEKIESDSDKDSYEEPIEF